MTLATLPAAGGSDGSSIDYQGMPGQATPVAFDGWVPIIGASIDGGGLRPFLLDTGAPMTVLDSTAQPGLDEGLAAVELGAFELTFADYQATAWDVFTDSAEGDGVAGIVGGDLLRHFAFSLDYQGSGAGSSRIRWAAPRRRPSLRRRGPDPALRHWDCRRDGC